MSKVAVPLFSLLVLCSLAQEIRGADPLPPAVAGFERWQGHAAPAALGHLLIGELNCVACHKPASRDALQRFSVRAAPDLRKVGARITPQYLAGFLDDPQSIKPGVVMPHLLHGIDAKEEAVDALVHFLVSQGGPIAEPRLGGTQRTIEQGRELFHSVGCVACHLPDNADGITTPIVPLSELSHKTTVDQLATFLVNPLKTHPSGRMPDFHLEPAEARAVAVYLLREQLDNPQSAQAGPGREQGLAFEYYEISGMNRLPDFSAIEPRRFGTVPGFALEIPGGRRSHHFALRYTGLISVPESGTYRFTTRSDDGSKLFINGNTVVDNDGVHPMVTKSGEVDLRAGDHEIEVQFFQAGGEYGLIVSWAGPGFPADGEEIPAEVLWNSHGEPMIPFNTEPFTVNLARAEEGRRLFGTLGCAACHHLDGTENVRTAGFLEDLDPSRVESCLSGVAVKSLPHYNLSATQREALAAAIEEEKSPQSLASEQIVARTLAAYNCYACHERHGIGGPDRVRAGFFESLEGVDLGEEGKIPPTLTGVGAKFKPKALERILLDHEFQVRHYMLTRMPVFPEDVARELVKHLVAVDQKDYARHQPEFSEESWKLGHRLAGTLGLSCVACHNIAGERGVGIPGIDLATTYERLNPGWFKRFLLDPAAYKEQTRMPHLWPEGQSPFPDLAGGEPGRQIDAIWTYLSLGNSMPLPEGIQPAGTVAMELIPTTEPIVHRTAMLDIGPRAIAAGFPEKLHVAFDASHVRLAQVWRGRFFDAAGVAGGRTDTFLGPLGEDVLNMPPGPAFAVLESRSAPWPAAKREERNIGGRFRGYILDEQRRPVFRYTLGGVDIREQPLPVVQPGGAILVRQFELRAESGAAPDLYFLGAVGRQIEPMADGSYLVDGQMTVRLESDAPLKPFVRKQPHGSELILPVPRQEETTFRVTIRW